MGVYMYVYYGVIVGVYMYVYYGVIVGVYMYVYCGRVPYIQLDSLSILFLHF